MPRPFRLPHTVCLRVTRNCNARCTFCLAPPDGCHPDAAQLARRLDWIAERGAGSVQFCGGEPTLHDALPQLIGRARERGLKTSLTTNGIALPEGLLPQLRSAGTRVRVSLHGPPAHHDALVGEGGFRSTLCTLDRLQAFGVPTSLQSTIISKGIDVLEWLAGFAVERRIGRLGLLPFLPRGRGRELRGEYGLCAGERRELRERVRQKRRELSGVLDLRWLDLTARPVLVVEADGRVVLEGASEALDRVLCTIPGPG